MRVCKGCDHTRPVPIFSGHVCVSTEYTGLMWRGVLSALGSLWRQNQDIGTELKSCQKHWNWFSLTMPDLPSVVRCFCSAADLLFLFFWMSYSEFSVLVTWKSKVYFTKCIRDRMTLFVMNMVLLRMRPREASARSECHSLRLSPWFGRAYLCCQQGLVALWAVTLDTLMLLGNLLDHAKLSELVN